MQTRYAQVVLGLIGAAIVGVCLFGRRPDDAIIGGILSVVVGIWVYRTW